MAGKWLYSPYSWGGRKCSWSVLSSHELTDILENNRWSCVPLPTLPSLNHKSGSGSKRRAACWGSGEVVNCAPTCCEMPFVESGSTLNVTIETSKVVFSVSLEVFGGCFHFLSSRNFLSNMFYPRSSKVPNASAGLKYFFSQVCEWRGSYLLSCPRPVSRTMAAPSIKPVTFCLHYEK